jgi:hypothetical protein
MPPADERAGMVERVAGIATSLTIRNVMAVCMLMVAAAPVYFVWEMVRNDKLRAQVFSSARIVEGMDVPCLVYAIGITGQPERYAVILAYETEGRFEYDIAVRSPGILGVNDVTKACDLAHKQALIMHGAVGSPSERK